MAESTWPDQQKAVRWHEYQSSLAHSLFRASASACQQKFNLLLLTSGLAANLLDSLCSLCWGPRCTGLCGWRLRAWALALA